MKKLLLVFALICCFAMPPVVWADDDDDDDRGGFRGGYKDGGAAITSVANAKTMPDDAKVALEGWIEKRVDDDEYLFKDNTGSIIVEIDDDDWNGVVVGPGDKIMVYGEVDRDDGRVEIEADHVVKK